MNLELQRDEVQAYLLKNNTTPLDKFIFKGSPFPAISIQELAQQLDGKRRVKNKLPLWHTTNGILFPPKLNLEQTSSEATAQYKAALVLGNTLLDMTGGFGIDSYYFSKIINSVTHIEMNDELSAFAKANFKTLNAQNINTVVGDSITYLTNEDLTFDTVFIDPARRDSNKDRVFKLSDCLPNVSKYLDLLLSKCKRLIVKTSPLLDISRGLSELRSVSEIHIVAVKNEVKELIWILESTPKEELECISVNLKPNGIDKTVVKYSDALNECALYDLPAHYLYEPNAALMKSGTFNWISSHFGISKLHKHTHLYTSHEPVHFPGRCFKILNVLPFDKRVKKHLNILKANITTRNFKLSVTDLRKRFNIKEGGDTYLFFTTNMDTNQIVVVCEKY